MALLDQTSSAGLALILPSLRGGGRVGQRQACTFPVFVLCSVTAGGSLYQSEMMDSVGVDLDLRPQGLGRERVRKGDVFYRH